MSNVHVVKKPITGKPKRRKCFSFNKAHHTQEKAIEQGKTIVINSNGGELIIHGIDGKIRDKNTYVKKDPYPPVG
ncbi:MAG: DUF2188 domain-containing protein [Ignavibacteria bacterium]|nr:DUF2188 domain-containing protein [Ignavibacteria bacterium]